MKVKANKGAGGVDRESIEKFEEDLEVNIERIHQELKRNEYRPQPVRRVWIPKPNGEKRGLGIPAVRDRVVQQATLIRLEPIFETIFVESSYGFRPNRSAHQAVDEVSINPKGRVPRACPWVNVISPQGVKQSLNCFECHGLARGYLRG